LAEAFAPFSQPVFERCIKIIHQNLEEYLAAVNNPILDTPDKDFLVTSLDLLSAIIQAVDEKQSAALVSGSRPHLFDLLQFCMEDPENEVRQSSYALLGDCAKFVFPQLEPFLPRVLPILIRQLDLDLILDEQIETGFSVVNNACWSAGEISIQHGKGMGPYVPQLVQRYLEILGNPEVSKSVLENAAIALGRLGLENSDLMSPHLATFSDPFLKSISTVDYTLEKATAFKGFCLIVLGNPQAMEKDLAHLFTAIARYKHTEEDKTNLAADLQQIFGHVKNPSTTPRIPYANSTQTLDGYKSLMPDFNAFINVQLLPADVNNLRAVYNL
jgi:hypothetical protein